MKKLFLPHSAFACLACAFIAGTAHAQSITFSGDTTPSGNPGAIHNAIDITVGNTGTGTLDVLSGGVLVNSGEAVIGAAAGSAGSATVADSSSQWDNTYLTVGNSGIGMLTIKNAGYVNSHVGYVGRQAGGAGTVTVDGPGSTWMIFKGTGGDYWIGEGGGSGTLNVLNGALAATSGKISTAVTAGSKAEMLVDGAESRLEGFELCAFGVADLSMLQISNGGTVNCRNTTYLAHGNVSLRGSDSKWIMDSSLDIGYTTPSSKAILNIGEGSAVVVATILRLPYADNAAATSTGTINIEGAARPGALSAASVVFGLNSAGAINFNHTDASGNYQFATPLSGPGQVNVNNSGTTLLSGNNHYSGTTSVNAGVLRAGSASGLSNASDFVVASGGTLDMHTYSPTLNSLANAGVVTLLSGGSNAVLTVANHYSGNGGAVQLNTVLEADDSATERLVINGDSSGTTTLNIHNLGGAGAPTSGTGILVVQVAGASNGTFSLPAPGYVEAGGFHYVLVKAGNNWYLQTETRAEALAPEASVSCTPAELTDTENQVSSCTVSLNAPAALDFSINLNVPAASPRYTTTCTSPMLIAANASHASCTITATPNTTANDGDVLVDLSIAPPTVADAYTVAGPAAQVLIKDAGATRAAPTPVPSLGALGLVSLASLMAVLGMRRTRKPTERRA